MNVTLFRFNFGEGGWLWELDYYLGSLDHLRIKKAANAPR